jgi:hypothetical protein
MIKILVGARAQLIFPKYLFAGHIKGFFDLFYDRE